MKVWKQYLENSRLWDLFAAVMVCVLAGYLTVIITNLDKQVINLELKVNNQEVQIQEAREERDHNPIIIAVSQTEHGIASWYGEPEHGQIRADGQVYDMYELHTAAHSKLPLGTTVLVTNLKNHKSVIVRINDRLPKVWNKSGRIVDLSFAAGQEVDMIRDGLVRVELKVIITSEDMTPEMIHEKRKILETVNDKN